MTIMLLLGLLLFKGECELNLIRHPGTVHACGDSDATFSVQATGSNITFQWFKDGMMLGGETNATLQLGAVTVADEGAYSCEVRTDCGTNRMSRMGWLFIVPPYFTPQIAPQWRTLPDASSCFDMNGNRAIDLLDFIALINNDDPSQTCRMEVAQNQSALFLHRVFRASTDDAGATFTPENLLVLDHASVPDVTFGKDQHLWMYYVSGETDYHSIWVARTDDKGDFQPLRCITLNGEPLRSGVDPDIVAMPDGRLRLFYYSNFGAPAPGVIDPHYIETAVSSDGIHFYEEGVVLETDGGTDPSAIRHSTGTWVMAVPVNGLKMQIATSPDGVNWTELLQLDTSGIPELVEEPDGDIILFIGIPNGNNEMKRYRSENVGQSWTAETNITVPGVTHVPDEVNHPSILRYSPTSWDMYYVSVAEE